MFDFDPKDYKGNIEYCKYVFDKNNELDLGLKTNNQIQFVADRYKSLIDSIRGNNGYNEVYEDEKALRNAVKLFDDFCNRVPKFKTREESNTTIKSTTNGVIDFPNSNNIVEEEDKIKMAA